MLSSKLSVSVIGRAQAGSLWLIRVVWTQRPWTRRPLSADLCGETPKAESTGGKDAPGLLKTAVTNRSELSVTTHDPVPEHAPPDHPVNWAPVAGVAVRVTWVPAGKIAEHAVPQLIPGTELVTVPDPEPVLVNHSAWSPGGTGSNVAVTDWSEL